MMMNYSVKATLQSAHLICGYRSLFVGAGVAGFDLLCLLNDHATPVVKTFHLFVFAGGQRSDPGDRDMR
jgi:hypothetical protein